MDGKRKPIRHANFGVEVQSLDNADAAYELYPQSKYLSYRARQEASLIGRGKLYLRCQPLPDFSVDLPIIANIIEASEEQPYLGLIMELDLTEISQLIVDSELAFTQSKEAQKGIAVGELSESLLDAFVRLAELLDEGQNIKILAPIIKREIFYRLLMSEQGTRLHQIATAGSHSHQIAKAIDWLKNNFVKPLSVGDLASYTGMSKSSFYTHFRSMTSMTPLQFQKKLRLSEARRLMLTENLDAMAATFKVGYESPSQFSREYSRLFGAPPSKDIKSLRENLG